MYSMVFMDFYTSREDLNPIKKKIDENFMYVPTQTRNYSNLWIEFDICAIIAKPSLLQELELRSQRYILNLSYLDNDFFSTKGHVCVIFTAVWYE